MSSLFNSMTGAAANAMEGAAIGRAIGNANDRAAHAESQLDIWYRHAKLLEANVNHLQEQLRASEAHRKSLEEQLATKDKQFEEFKGLATGAMNNSRSALSENADYGREIKKNA